MKWRMRQHTPYQGLKVRIPWMQKHFLITGSPLFIWERHWYLQWHFCPSLLVASPEHVVVQPPSLALWTDIKNKHNKNYMTRITPCWCKLNNGLNQYTLPFFDDFLGHNSPCSVDRGEMHLNVNLQAYLFCLCRSKVQNVYISVVKQFIQPFRKFYEILRPQSYLLFVDCSV